MNFPEFQKWQAALCAWREARGEYERTSGEGIRAIIHVIANRAKQSGKSWAEIIYAKWQFSSMTANNDPQLSVVPLWTDSIFAYCYRVADQVFNNVDPDPTQGATHYFNPHLVLPEWAKGMQKTATIGNHDFYKV